MGYGAYCLFTDASMVGQPTKKDEFKVIAIGMIRFNDDVSAAVSLLTDDAAGPDFAAMLKAVSGATVGPAK
jgi:L-fucose mutarotase/ribose pyranase (RbsD/FucU family)